MVISGLKVRFKRILKTKMQRTLCFQSWAKLSHNYMYKKTDTRTGTMLNTLTDFCLTSHLFSGEKLWLFLFRPAFLDEK